MYNNIRKKIQDTKRKYTSKFIYFLFLSSILLSLLVICVTKIPDYSLLFQSEDEKLRSIDYWYIEELIFIRDNTEENSVVLFLQSQIFQIGKVYLYPQRGAAYIEYWWRTVSDQDLLLFLKDNTPPADSFTWIYSNEIHYIIVDDIILNEVGFPLSTNTTYFTKIPSTSSFYLLKINRTAL